MRIVTLILALALAAPALASAAPRVETLAYGPDPAQRLDIHRPEVAAGPAPVLVMVHGGGWRWGDRALPGVWQTKAAYWGARGYVLVSLDYRMLPAADPLDQARDVAAALRFVQGHAGTLGLDPARIVLMGHSAGAHLAALVGAAPASFGTPPLAGIVALDSGAYDVSARMQARIVPRLYRDAFGTDPAFWTAVSPSAQVHAPVHDWLLVCSTERPAACPETEGFARALGPATPAVTVLPVAMRHRAINVETGDPASPVTAALDAFLRRIGLP